MPDWFSAVVLGQTKVSVSVVQRKQNWLREVLLNVQSSFSALACFKQYVHPVAGTWHHRFVKAMRVRLLKLQRFPTKACLVSTVITDSARVLTTVETSSALSACGIVLRWPHQTTGRKTPTVNSMWTPKRCRPTGQVAIDGISKAEEHLTSRHKDKSANAHTWISDKGQTTDQLNTFCCGQIVCTESRGTFIGQNPSTTSTPFQGDRSSKCSSGGSGTSSMTSSPFLVHTAVSGLPSGGGGSGGGRVGRCPLHQVSDVGAKAEDDQAPDSGQEQRGHSHHLSVDSRLHDSTQRGEHVVSA